MSFRDEMNSALAEIFDGLGEVAIYTPQAGEARSIRVRFRSADAQYTTGGLGVLAENPRVRFRAAEIAAPAAGDTLLYMGVTYRVGTPSAPDEPRLLWEAELSRA